MSDSSRDMPEASGVSGDGRKTRRRAVHGVLVAIEATGDPAGHWVADAVDINADGMGLMLPPELAADREVLLSFKLDEAVEFSRVPSVVRHQDGLSGGVNFSAWTPADRLKLLEYLVVFYERHP